MSKSQECRALLVSSIDPSPKTLATSLTSYVRHADYCEISYESESSVHCSGIAVYRFPNGLGYLVHSEYYGSCYLCQGTLYRLVQDSVRKLPLEEQNAAWNGKAIEIVKEWIGEMEWFESAEQVLGYLSGYRGSGLRYRDEEFDAEYREELKTVEAFLARPPFIS